MKKEIWQSGQPVLRDDLLRAQTTKEEAINERLLDTLGVGIVNGSQFLAETIPFEMSVNITPYTVDIGTGIAYSSTGERIVLDSLAAYDAAAPTATTDNGIGGTSLTPQSTGSTSVPLSAGLVNYVFITYLQTTDTSVFTLQEDTNERLFTSGTDGYKIEVVTDAGPSISSTPDTFAPSANSVFLGAVDLAQVLSIENRSFLLLKQTNLTAEVPTALTSLEGLGQPYAAGQQVTFDEHTRAIGSGVVTPTNPHGLTIADLSGSLSGKSAEQHEKFFHESGISSGQSSTTSALYGSVVDSAGSPLIGPTYARDNFLIKKLLPSGTQNFAGDGVTVTFTLTGGLSFVPGSGNLKVFVEGVLQATPSQYSEVGNTAVTFVTAPGVTAQVQLAVDGEIVQINGITISSAQLPEDYVFYFVDAAGNFLDNGVYTAYLDGVAGALRLAHAVSPTNTAYRVYGVTSGQFTNSDTISITSVQNNPNNLLLWQVTWDSTGFGLGNDNFSLVTDKRYFGTVGSNSLLRDSATDTVIIDHNVTIEPEKTLNLLPAGMVAQYFGTTDPDGWKIINGRSLATVSEPRLFALLGYTYGGSGANFNLPDLRGDFLRGCVIDVSSGTEAVTANFATGEFTTGAAHNLNRDGFPVRLSSINFGGMPTGISSADIIYGAAADASTDLLTMQPYSIPDPLIGEQNHGLHRVGAPVHFTGTLPTPLVAGTIYYAIPVTPTTFRVATTSANAISNTYIDLTSSTGPNGTTWVSKNITQNTYYSIIVGSTVFKLAATLSDAYAGTAIAFSSNGSGLLLEQWADPEAGLRLNNSGAFSNEVGARQQDALARHNHAQTIGAGGNNVFNVAGSISYGPGLTGQTGVGETRPRNVLINHIIKT